MKYVWEDIERIVRRIVYAIDHDKYDIAENENRQKNTDFLAEYGLVGERIKGILFELQVDDFSETVNNINIGFEDEKLYIFGLKRRLLPSG